MAAKSTVENTALKHGLIITAGLIVLFFLMKIAGLLHIIELRVLNIFILAGGVVMSIRSFRSSNPQSFTYLKGLGLGVLTGIWGSIFFGLFVFAYTQFMDPAFMQTMVENEPFGQYLNPYISGVAVAVEGIASCMIVSFIVMNYVDTVETM